MGMLLHKTLTEINQAKADKKVIEVKDEDKKIKPTIKKKDK